MYLPIRCFIKFLDDGFLLLKTSQTSYLKKKIATQFVIDNNNL